MIVSEAAPREIVNGTRVSMFLLNSYVMKQREILNLAPTD